MNFTTLAVAAFALSIPASAADELYHEALRPQVHFTARQWTYHKLQPGQRDEGWLNDANGLVYYAGEWHYFAQRWAHCWIHAVSKDLVHWEELKPAFWEDDKFGPVQSGTIVVDTFNVSGLASGKDPVLVAFWASWNNKDQCVSYSNDHGRTWTKYPGNPVLSHGERDPQVFFHKETGKWVMVLSGPGGYFFFTSDNLLTWKEESFSAGYYECPDMFRLAADGKGPLHWVLMNGDGSYRVGDFDGKAFTPKTRMRRLDWGNAFYATQSWHDVPSADGRRIQTAWMRADGNKFYPNMPFSQQTSFPAVMTLRNIGDTLRVCRNPVAELKLLHASSRDFSGPTLAAKAGLPLDTSSAPLHIEAWLTLSNGSDGAAAGAITVRGNTITFAKQSLAIGNDKGIYAEPVSRVKIELLIDVASIEAFGNDGEISLTSCVNTSGLATAIRCDRGSVRVDSLMVHRLNSIWPSHTPQGFHSSLGGTWTDVKGSFKDSANGRIGSGSGDLFSLNDKQGGDFTYEGELEFFTANAASLAFRMNDDAGKGYVLNVDRAGLLKLWSPGRPDLKTFATPINEGQPYHVKVSARGSDIKVWLNYSAQPVMNYTDPNPILSGRFGINFYNGTGVVQDVSVDGISPTALGAKRPARGPGTGAAAGLRRSRMVFTDRGRENDAGGRRLDADGVP